MRQLLTLALAGLATAAATPAVAEVAVSSEAGFVSHNEAEMPVPPAEVWDWMLRPGDWWNSEHTYSGDAANMTIEPVAGGCFCEAIPATSGVPAGQIEHMRVVYVDPRVRTLRLTGCLGPLQTEALTCTLTMVVQPSGTGSKIDWDYVVGGYARMSLKELAPVVDGVVGEQLSRLARLRESARATPETPAQGLLRGF